ncbi:RsmB/NOP family class I SAM-dependent RNA methyltransferase [Mesorhizobium xinjiangense]|uniref:RsmB/NOP family class I SAM-dependent RNA methyltransferase n=1 Tax=Mesorhizobium xinjiangense TaxID=2678685 RepID=UPI0012EE9F12|nr:RsmB/NOP family class I SAM-dependent RNA methyltransferase [Mesorhizobium xinjiangense]
MRLGGRLSAAIEVLHDIQSRHRPAAEALKDWGLSHRFAGAGDRAAIGNIVYDALRRRRSAAWLLGDQTPRALAFGALLLEWGESASSLNAALEGDHFAPPAMSEDELRAVEANTLAAAPAEISADCPDWCAPYLEQAFGSAWAEEGRALAARPPLDLRANTLKSSRERVLAELAGQGAVPTRIASDGLRIAPVEGGRRHPNVQAEPAFRKGWFEVQDEGSQIAGELAGALAGMQVLDYCAGGGGKTLELAAQMNNRGQIFAHDAEKTRLAPIFDRLRRADARNVQVVSKADELETLGGRMDIVLVDAPCTGSGTWRRRPDAKWRLTQRQLDLRVNEQAQILDKASRFVKPGGRLVYITCSVFPQENGGQLRSFLARNPRFRPVDHDKLWQGTFADHAGRVRIDGEAGVVMTPHLTGTDGFFFAAMERNPQ